MQDSNPIPSDPVAFPKTDTAPSTPIDDVRLLIQWIESHPEYSFLVDQARQDHRVIPQKSQVPDPAWRKALRWSKDQILARGDELHGNAIITPGVQQDAEVTARVIAAGNLINFVGTFPLFLFALKSLGFFSLPLSIITSLLLLKISNDTATVVARGKRGSRHWAYTAALCGFIPLSILQSLVSGIGSELFNNRTVLAQLWAEDLVQQRFEMKQQRIEALKTISTPAYLSTEKTCREGEAELNKLSKSDPRWNAQYAKLYGTWSDRSRVWTTLPAEMLPVCKRLDRFQQDNQAQIEKEQQALQILQEKRSQLGNDLKFLRQDFATVYEQHFDASEDFISGVQAIAIATDHFIANLEQGNVTQLGLSLFFFTLSCLTSLVACVMVFTFGRREDVQMSWSEELRRERDQWLTNKFAELIQHQEAEEQRLEALDVPKDLPDQA
ncbi:MAG: hypothetical protein MH252_11420 [Thermosynechococcaceae cyanobacterium MS004]|nr:hypothetical protein [Thermosynechococcaceae cyanobacterium MS004]